MAASIGTAGRGAACPPEQCGKGAANATGGGAAVSPGSQTEPYALARRAGGLQAEGHSPTQIADTFNRERIASLWGDKWQSDSIQRLLREFLKTQ